jgi:hypothetical protein
VTVTEVAAIAAMATADVVCWAGAPARAAPIAYRVSRRGVLRGCADAPSRDSRSPAVAPGSGS